MKLISEELLDGVTRAAQENSRLRMNYNFHESLDAPIHRLLNALEPGTYLPPHRHSDKEETYVCCGVVCGPSSMMIQAM